MSAFMLGLLYATDYCWLPEYVAKVPEIARKYGGHYHFLAQHGTIELGEGDMPVPTGVVAFDFPSREAIKAFLESEEYKPFIELRNKYSTAQILMFDSKPVPARPGGPQGSAA